MQNQYMNARSAGTPENEMLIFLTSELTGGDGAQRNTRLVQRPVGHNGSFISLATYHPSLEPNVDRRHQAKLLQQHLRAAKHPKKPYSGRV